MEQSTTRKIWLAWKWRAWLTPLLLGLTAVGLGLCLMMGVLSEVDAVINQQQTTATTDGVGGGSLTNMAFDPAVFHAAWTKYFGKGVLSGEEQYTIQAAQKAGVNPALFAAIMGTESGWGTSYAVRVQNNPSGQMTGSHVIHYSSLEEGIDATGATLHNLVVKGGLNTLQELQRAYAPVGASNDPNGMNSGWLKSVTTIIKYFLPPADAAAVLSGKAGNNDVKITGEKMSYFDKAYAAGRAQLGKPYVFGAGNSGSNPSGFDCSGFVQWSLRQAGVSLPRSAQEQYDATTRISKSQVKAGDLIFFQGTYAGPHITHVGIVLNSTQMINAAGKDVNIASYTTAYWLSHFAGFGRVK